MARRACSIQNLTIQLLLQSFEKTLQAGKVRNQAAATAAVLPLWCSRQSVITQSFDQTIQANIAIMWVLEAQSLGSNDERSVRVQTIKHYLTAGSHVVGRNVTAGQSNVIIEEDKSISRGHAVISVAYAEQVCLKVRGAPAKARLQSPARWNRLCLTTSDTSRYGTLVNRVELTGAETYLKEGDLLQFGHKSTFRLAKAFSLTGTLNQAQPRNMPIVLFDIVGSQDGTAALHFYRKQLCHCSKWHSLVRHSFSTTYDALIDAFSTTMIPCSKGGRQS